MTVGFRVPYVSAAEFTAYPQFLDLNDLITGGSAATQLDELTQVLLRAGSSLDGYCKQPLAAHTHTTTVDVRVRPDGCVRVKPPHRPYVAGSISSVSYKVPGLPTVYPISDLSGVDYVSGLLSIPILVQSSVPYTVFYGSTLRVTYSYVAGFPVTALTADANAGAVSLAVADPTGVTAGEVLRVADPSTASAVGTEEWVTVAPTYAAGTSPVTLAAGTASAHVKGVQVDGLPADVKLACVLWAMGLLMRPTSGGSDDAFADAAEQPTTSSGRNPRRTGRGLIRQAQDLLDAGGYVRVMP